MSARHIKAVLLDCGDTLIDEGTEVRRHGTDVVLSGELIPGAREMLAALGESGYRLALVADGPRETFENLLKPKGLWNAFEAHVISGDLGVLKPSQKMFATAFKRLGLDEADAGAVVMVGNNLMRDIKGANRFGIRSVFFTWSDRRTHEPADPEEVPDHTIRTLAELPPLLNAIERQMVAAPHGVGEAV